MTNTGFGPVRRDDVDLRHYLRCVAGHAPLEKQEESLLLRRSRQGDREAFDRLIGANLQYVVRLARTFRNRGLSDLDLIAEGTVALIMTVRYDDRCGEIRVIAVAAWRIHHALRAATTAPAQVIMLPPRAGAALAEHHHPGDPESGSPVRHRQPGLFMDGRG